MTFKRNARKPAFQQHGVQRCQENGKNLASKKSVKISWWTFSGIFHAVPIFPNQLFRGPRKISRGPGYPSLPESCQNHEVLHHSIQLKPAACKKLLKRSKDLKRSEKGLSQKQQIMKSHVFVDSQNSPRHEQYLLLVQNL